MHNDKTYFINHPVFVKYKRKFQPFKLRHQEYLKSVHINERIVEVPFALKAMSGLKGGASVLDVGCSESILPLYLCGLGLDVTGVDLRDYPYDFPGLNFVKTDIMHMPFEKECFDAITCVSTIEHIGLESYDLHVSGQQADKQSLKEIARVLKKGGCLVLTVPFGVPGENRHQRVYGRQQIEELMTGFHVQKCVYYRSCVSGISQNNFWQKVEELEAAQVLSGASTACVCLIRAIKK